MFILLRVLELGIQISVDTERLHSLIILNLTRALSLLRILRLPHAYETLTSLIVGATHNVASGREHALNLAILAIHKLVTA